MSSFNLSITKIIIILLIFLSFFGCTQTTNEKLSFSDPTSPDCQFNKYNCSDFNSQKEAQAMLELCGTDIHDLDRDNDGITDT